MISGLAAIVDHAVLDNYKVEHIIFGMAHRGRLNTLACVLNKKMEEIFAEFQEIKDLPKEGVWGQSGDVKYHLGVTSEKQYPEEDKSIKLTILANPSHLETVNPVVYGSTKAWQDAKQDE